MKIRGIKTNGGFRYLQPQYKGDNNAYVCNYYRKNGDIISNYWQVHDFGKGYSSHWD